MLDTTEKLPLLRFVKTAEKDGIATEQAGKLQYMDVIKVYIRAPGDLKTEVVDIAEQTGYDITEATVNVEKPHTVLREVDGEMQEVTEKITVPEKKRFPNKKTITPWLDKQRERFHHKKITENYLRYCEDAFERFKRNEDQPINGTPLAMWAGAPESVKKMAIECGILSVEAAAEMTSEAMSAIGMGAVDLKKSAQAFVASKNDMDGTIEKLKKLEAEAEDKDARLDALEKKLLELSSMNEKPSGKGGKRQHAA